MFDSSEDGHEHFTKNLIETVTLLCRNNVKHMNELKIQGLIALTSDSTNFMVIPINELITKNTGYQHNYHDNIDNSSMYPMLNTSNFPCQNISRPSFGRSPSGRGRAMPQRGGSIRMKIPNQFLTPNKNKAKQNLKFFTPQKKSPLQRPQTSPIAGNKRTLHQRTNYMQDIETDSESRMAPADNQLFQKRRILEIKQETGEMANQQLQNSTSTQNNFTASGDVFVLSDEEDGNGSGPIRVKKEITIRAPNNKRSCNSIDDTTNLDTIVANSITACQRNMPMSYIKEEPTVSIENLKSELSDNSYERWTNSTSLPQQHSCLQCGNAFNNLRSLRQHIRQVHSANNDNLNTATPINGGVGSVAIGEIISPANVVASNQIVEET